MRHLVWEDTGAKDTDQSPNLEVMRTLDHIHVDQHVTLKEPHFVIHVSK